MVTITWCSTTFLAEDLRYCVNRQAAGLGYDSQLLLECDRMETPMTLLASQARSVGLDNFVLMWDRARQRTSWMRHEHTCDDPCNRMTGLLTELYKSFDDLLLRSSLSPPWRGIFIFGNCGVFERVGLAAASLVSAEVVLLHPSASSSSVCVFHMPCRRRCWWEKNNQKRLRLRQWRLFWIRWCYFFYGWRWIVSAKIRGRLS